MENHPLPAALFDYENDMMVTTIAEEGGHTACPTYERREG
jgi:hypothetical protein